MASPSAELDGLVGPTGDGDGAGLVSSASPFQPAAARLLRHVEAMLAAWVEYDANRRVPVERQRELAQPRIEAASLNALAVRLRGMGDAHWAYVSLLDEGHRAFTA